MIGSCRAARRLMRFIVTHPYAFAFTTHFLVLLEFVAVGLCCCVRRQRLDIHYWLLLDSQLFAVLLPLVVMDGRGYVLLVAVCCRVLQSIVACSCLLVLLLLIAFVCNGLPFAGGFAQHAGFAAIRCRMLTFCDRLCFGLFAKMRTPMQNADLFLRNVCFGLRSLNVLYLPRKMYKT